MCSSVCTNPPSCVYGSLSQRGCSCPRSQSASAGRQRPRVRAPAPGLEEQLRDRHEAETDSTGPRSRISSYTYYIILSSRAGLDWWCLKKKKDTHTLMWEPQSHQHVPNLAVYIGRCHVQRRVKDWKSLRPLHHWWCGSVLTCQGPDFSSLRNVEKWRRFRRKSTKWWWGTIRVNDRWRRQPKNTIMWFFFFLLTTAGSGQAFFFFFGSGERRRSFYCMDF